MNGVTLAALDAIGIFEGGADKLCAAVFGVIAPREVRIERLISREGISREYAEKRISAQKSDEYYKEVCTACLVNDGTVEEFAARCEAVFTAAIKNGRKERLPDVYKRQVPLRSCIACHCCLVMSTCRGLLPSKGPTIPNSSIWSTRRAARE